MDLIVVDGFAISPMGTGERNDLLEVLDDRVGSRSTLITSQLPVKAWRTELDDPTLTDAILERVGHSSHKMALKGIWQSGMSAFFTVSRWKRRMSFDMSR